MYESFFGLQRAPFSLVPDPDVLFWGGEHKTAFNLMEYGLSNRAMFIVMTGEPGTGKTTVLNALLAQLPRETTVGVLTHTHAKLGSLMPWVLMAYGVDSAGFDEVECYKAFRQFVFREHERGRRVVLAVDEAHNLEPSMLEELRLLSNLNESRRPPLQILLSGQPALRARLQSPDLVQFAQRVSIAYHLKALTPEDTPGYIEHRLASAGAARPIFSPCATRAVHQLTGGNARLINQICDLSMAYAYAADAGTVTLPLVVKAANDRRAGGILPVSEEAPEELMQPDVRRADADEYPSARPSVVSPPEPGHVSAPSDALSGAEPYRQGVALKQAGSYQAAIACFDAVATLSPERVRALTQRALCFSAMGYPEKAVDSLCEVVGSGAGTGPERHHARYVLAQSLETVGRMDDALDQYRALQLEPGGGRDVTGHIRRLTSSRVLSLFLRMLNPWAWRRSSPRA